LFVFRRSSWRLVRLVGLVCLQRLLRPWVATAGPLMRLPARPLSGTGCTEAAVRLSLYRYSFEEYSYLCTCTAVCLIKYGKFFNSIIFKFDPA